MTNMKKRIAAALTATTLTIGLTIPRDGSGSA